MVLFWMAAGALAAAAALLVMLFARRAAAAPTADPTLAVFKRQLAEVDELAARGLLSDAERGAARAEAGRRLLRAAGTVAAPARPAPRWAAPLAAGLAAVAALILYLVVGRPSLPDQPIRQRVAAWRANPEQLGPQEAAAVLERIIRDRPNDAEGHAQLGRARLAGGDPFGAVRAFESAAQLQPDHPERWTDLARAYLSLDPPAAPEARDALQRALAAAPGDLNARYWLGQTAIVEGDTAGGLQIWRALAAALAADDPRRAALEQEIAAAGSGPDPAIAAMVEGLAARLQRNPNDAEGWARLARSYAVLGRQAELQAVLAEARRRFRGEELRRIESEAAAGRELQRGG